MKLRTQIFLGLAVGVMVGAYARLPGSQGVLSAVLALETLGVVFIRLITMVVVPMVIASLFVGIATLGDVRSLGRLGGKTLAYFACTTLAAAIVGLSVAVLAPDMPGVPGSRTFKAPGIGTPPTLGQDLLAWIPQNPFAVAAQGDLLPLIVAVCIFAAAATVARGRGKSVVVQFFEGMNEICMVVIRWLMRLVPVAVLLLIAATVAKTGMDMLEQLVRYALVVVAAMVVHVAIVLVPVIRFGAGRRVIPFFRSVSDALVLAFSTASSSATLPVSMAAAETRLRIRNEIAGFVLPAGTTLNKNGAAAYKAVTAIFLAHVYGVPLDGRLALTIVFTSTLAAFAGAGVPGSSLVTTLIVLNAIGLGPDAAAGIALVAGVDRPLDMCRTLVNTIGNLAGAAWISRSEGEVLADPTPS
jgi:Na+/H+-dicarboxylate symporter